MGRLTKMLVARVNVLFMVLVLVTCAIHMPKRSSDPVMETCSPLCEEETVMEMQCAMSSGCYDVTDEDSDQFFDCVTPCWDLVGPCFNLCVASFDLILKQCFNSCSSVPEDLTCIQSCYYILFLELKNDVLYGGLNGSHHNISTTTRDNTDTPSTSASPAIDQSPTSNAPGPTNLILAALEVNQFLQESFTDDVTTDYLPGKSVSDFEMTWRPNDNLNSIELPDLTEKSDDVKALARDDTTVTENLSRLAVLTGQSPRINNSETLLLPILDPNNDTEESAPGQRLLGRTIIKHLDDKTLQSLLESYDRHISDYLNFKFIHRKNFSGGLPQNASQLDISRQATDNPVEMSGTAAAQGLNTLEVTPINSMGVQDSKRNQERQDYVGMLNRANSRFLHLYGLIGPLPKDKKLEAHFGISKRRSDVDTPVVIG